MVKLQKACRNYTAWKETHLPEMKPWLFPEQNSLPALNLADIGKWELTASPMLDERDVVETTEPVETTDAGALSDHVDEDEESTGVRVNPLATTDGQRGTVEQIDTEVPIAVTEPAIPDMAVAAGAN